MQQKLFENNLSPLLLLIFSLAPNTLCMYFFIICLSPH